MKVPIVSVAHREMDVATRGNSGGSEGFRSNESVCLASWRLRKKWVINEFGEIEESGVIYVSRRVQTDLSCLISVSLQPPHDIFLFSLE
jgi:hypothetical protein